MNSVSNFVFVSFSSNRISWVGRCVTMVTREGAETHTSVSQEDVERSPLADDVHHPSVQSHLVGWETGYSQ